MKKIRTLLVTFEDQLLPWETSAFRGAVIEKVGRNNLLFTHHLADSQYLYSYPLIQYKSLHRQPAILCLGEGVDEIHKLFNQSSWKITVKERPVELKIDRLELGNVNVNVWEKQFQYNLSNWLGLNAANYKSFQQMGTDAEKDAMLARILTGNILSFAKGVGWQVTKPITVAITALHGMKSTLYKGVKLVSFDLSFSCNVFLPAFIGLGKGASHGMGVVRLIKNKSSKEDNETLIP